MRAAPVIPEHELIRCIGSGSYGHVWLARNTTGAWRAVKVVWRDSFQDDRPFEREWTGVRRFEALSRESPAFVDILQTGRAGDGSFFYYVMELADDSRGTGSSKACAGPVEGDALGYEPRTLSGLMRGGGRMSAEACLELGLGLARGLACLHSAGLLHRDIKPSNIVFVGGEARLADIGLVTDVGEARSYVGTDGYIPVEGPNSPQADVFGLGKVLYEAMTGLDRMEFPRVPPGLGEGPEGRRWLALNAVILKACAAARDARYASAEAMAADLEAVALGQWGSVGRGGAGRIPGARFLRGIPAGWAAVALAFLAAGAWAWRDHFLGSFLSGRSAPERVQGREASPAPANDPVARDARRMELLGQGLRLREEGDDAGALVWIADALADGSARNADDAEDRLRVADLLAGLPTPEATLHVGPGVYSVDFSPDGSRVATCHRDGSVQVWDLRPPGTRVGGPWATAGHPSRVRFSPDGRTLWLAPAVDLPATRAQLGVGQAIQWDASSGRLVSAPLKDILWAVFSSDGRWVAGVAASHAVVVADMREPGQSRMLGQHAKAVSRLAFSPDGTRLASVSDDGTARVWTMGQGGNPTHELRLDGMGSALAFDGTGQRLGTVAWDGAQRSSLEIWDLTGPGVRTRLERFPGPARGIQWLAGQRPAFMIGASLHGLRLIDETTPDRPPIGFGGARCLAWSAGPDGRFAVAGGEDGSVRVWDLASGDLVASLPRSKHPVVGVSFRPDGQQVMTLTEDGLLRTWSRWQGKRTSPRAIPEIRWGLDALGRPQVAAAVHEPSGRLLAAAVPTQGRGALVLAANLQENAPSRSIPLPEGMDVGDLKVSRDGQWWVAGDREPLDPGQPSKVWLGHRVHEGGSSQVLPHPTACQHLAFDPDAQHLLTLDASTTWRRWHLASARVVEQRHLPLPVGGGVALSEGGRLVVSIGESGRAMTAWDWDRLEVPRSLWTSPAPIHGLQFLPGSDWLLAEDEIRRRHVVHGRSGKVVALPEGSLDGGRIPWWNAPNPRLLHLLESSAVELVDLDKASVHRWRTPPDARGVRHAVLSRDGRWVAILDREDGVRWVEASSGRPIARRIVPGGRVRWVGFIGNSSLAILSDPHFIHVHTLSPWTGNAPALRDWATWVSGRRRDAQGGVEWLRPDSIARMAPGISRP